MSLIDSTVTVRRGGAYLTVPANAVERYLAKGYDVVDEDGNVLKESVPNDVSSLRMAYNKHVAKIKELEAENRELKKRLRELSTPVETATPKTTTTRKTTKKSTS